MSEGDRLVDALREGIDCVVRVGKPRDSDMVARRLGELEEVTCAAPAYLQRFGTPQSLDDLRHHRMVGFRSSATGALMPLAFTVAGQAQPITLPATVSVSAAESLVAAARAGLGIIQVPRYHLRGDLADGSLLPLLPDWPLHRCRSRCFIRATASCRRGCACFSIGSAGYSPSAIGSDRVRYSAP